MTIKRIDEQGALTLWNRMKSYVNGRLESIDTSGTGSVDISHKMDKVNPTGTGTMELTNGDLRILDNNDAGYGFVVRRPFGDTTRGTSLFVENSTGSAQINLNDISENGTVTNLNRLVIGDNYTTSLKPLCVGDKLVSLNDHTHQKLITTNGALGVYSGVYNGTAGVWLLPYNPDGTNAKPDVTPASLGSKSYPFRNTYSEVFTVTNLTEEDENVTGKLTQLYMGTDGYARIWMDAADGTDLNGMILTDTNTQFYKPVTMQSGGTGVNLIAEGIPSNAIVRMSGDGSNNLWWTATKSGAFYAESENGYPKFGTLPVAQGGTGATTAANARTNLGAAALDSINNFSKDQRISGDILIASGKKIKLGSSFGSSISSPAEGTISYSNGAIVFGGDITDGKGNTLSTHTHANITNSDGVGKVSITKDGDYYYLRPHEASICLNGSSNRPWYKTYTERLEVTSGAASFGSTVSITGVTTISSRIQPSVDGAETGYTNLGSTSKRFKNVYATVSAMSTSDLNYKRDLDDIDDRYIELFDLIKPYTYYFKNGDRVHTGFIAQYVEEAMERVGITPEELGFFCKDIKTKSIFDEEGNWQRDEEVFDENGNPEYIYALRYEEYIAIITEKIKRLEHKYNSEIEKLGAKLAELEAKLG